MNRLNIISLINPCWHTQINDFLVEHPEFIRLLPIVALDEFPCGFNKNPHETDIEAPANIFETVIYGVSHAGLSSEDGNAHYIEIISFFRDDCIFTTNMEFPFLEPNKKINTYREFINKLLENNISINDMMFTDLHIAESINGIGDSTIDLVNLLYANIGDECVIPYTDSYFIKGMEMFFEMVEITYDKLKEITTTWKNKKVGVMFIIQYAYFSNFVK
jgi:hypothetical protein